MNPVAIRICLIKELTLTTEENWISLIFNKEAG